MRLDTYVWTHHVKEKMKYYQLSEQRVKRVLRNPDRVEEGVSPDTVAVMQRNDTKKHKKEIWAMYQEKKEGEKTVISAWRYPGESPVGGNIEIPEDTLGLLADLE